MKSQRATSIAAWAALVLAVAAVVFSGAGGAIAAKMLPGPSLKPKK